MRKLRYLTITTDFGNNADLRNKEPRLWHESAYITDYVKRGVNEEQGSDCVRLNLECTLFPIDDRVVEAESVHIVSVPFNPEYFSMSPPMREKYLIDLTETGLKRYCDIKKKDFSIFKKYIDDLRLNSHSVGFYIPKKSCRKGSLSAKVYCVQNMTETVFFMDFFFKKTLIQRKLFAVSLPTADTYRGNIDHMEWSDDRTVSIYTYGMLKELYASVTLDADSAVAQSASVVSPSDVCEKTCEKVCRIKTIACKAIGIDNYDCNIYAWDEDLNGRIFIALAPLKKGFFLHLAIVDQSGSVILGTCDNYFSQTKLIDDFKKANGWISDLAL